VQARIIGINEEKRQVRLTMRNLFGPPEIPPMSFEERERDQPGRSGARKRKDRDHAKERVDRRFLDEAGHESLSMRDLLGEGEAKLNDESE